MNISESNFYEYAFQYLEGELNAGQKEKFMSFIAENQEYGYEFEKIKRTYLRPDQTVDLPNMGHLKKNFTDVETINASNIDEFCIAYLEGDLDIQSRIKFEKTIQNNDQFEKTFRLYRKLKLEPDKNIVYPSKEILIKTRPGIYRITVKRAIIALSVAASVLLFITIGIRLFTPDEIQQKPEVHAAGKGTDYAKSHNENKKVIPGISEIQPTYIQKSNMTDQSPEIFAEEYKYIPLDPLQPRTIIFRKSSDNEFIVQSSHFEAEHVPAINTGRSISQGRNLFPQLADLTPDEINVISALQYGLKGFNQLTESDVEFYAQRNENGKINRLTFITDNFQITRKLGKK